MANYFDQFDSADTPAAAGNFFDQFDKPEPSAAADIAKQIPSGLAVGAEAIPAAIPSTLGLIGRGAEYVFGKGDPEAVAQREQMQKLIAAQRGGGIAQYLPEPETTAGKYARTAAEAVPGMMGATKLSPLRAAGAGATSGLVSEAAGQATEGTGAEPYARAAGAVIGGGAALRQAERAAVQRATPSIEQLKAKAGGGYEQAKGLGVEIRPQAAETLAARLKGELSQAGLDENIAPKTWGILGKLEGAPADAVMTVNNLQALRRTLGNAAGSIDRSERLAAVQAKNAVDDFLANLPAGALIRGDAKQASALLREANANYAAAERAAELDRKITRAQLRASAANSGMNVANTIRQRMADILLTPALQRGYSPEELRHMERLVRGSALENSLRYAGNLMGGGGGLGQAVIGMGALGSAYATGNPELAALPVLGAGARMASNRLTLQNAARLNAMARARSPLGRTATGPLMTSITPAAPFGSLVSLMPQFGQ